MGIPNLISCSWHLPNKLYEITLFNLSFHSWKFGGQLRCSLSFHEIWWHWQDLLLDVSKLHFWCVCVGSCTSKAILFLETLALQSVEVHSTPSYAQRSFSTTNATASLQTYSASSTCETWRSHLNRSWRAKEKEVRKLMPPKVFLILQGFPCWAPEMGFRER